MSLLGRACSLLWETKSGFHGNSGGEDRARKEEKDRKDCGSCSYSNACLTVRSGRHGYDRVHASVREHCCLGYVNIFVDLEYQPTSNHTLNISKIHQQNKGTSVRLRNKAIFYLIFRLSGSPRGTILRR